MSKKHLVILIIIIVAILCVAGRFVLTKFAEKAQKENIEKSRVAHVELMNPFEIETSSTIESPGRVMAMESVDVVARVNGMILKQHYKDGDFVTKGQLLYTLDSNEFEIAVQSAQANLESARAAQYKTQKDFERAAELVKSDYISKSSYDQALAARNSANANVKACIAALNDAKRLLGYTKVYAPITGKISMTDITVGNYLTSPNTVLTKIVKIDPIFVTYSLDSAIYGKLKDDEIIPDKNQKQDIKVQITLPDGTVYDKQGNADFLDNVISESTGAITLRATFPNPNGRLIAGDFVNVKVFSNKVLTSLAVPQSVVMQDPSGKYLYVVDEDNIPHKTNITVSGQKGDNWLVASGITKEDKIVASGVSHVVDGVKVEVITKEENKETKKE